MSKKSQFPLTFNWQSTNPITGFLPPSANQGGGTKPSGTVSGTMSSTNTIYSQIIDISLYDNVGLEVTWTGTPTGTFNVYVSNSGINFYYLTIGQTQPAGAAGGYFINIQQLAAKYFLLEYTNSSGSGSLTVYGQIKDLN